MRIERYGVAIDLPGGWDGRIYKRAATDGLGSRLQTLTPAQLPTTHPVLHAANFPLPENRGDYGSGAVEIMTAEHVFLSLLEFHPDASRTALFARQGLPRPLPARAFSPNKLQRTIRGQGGSQFFFSENGRAFCLYVVLGSYAERGRLVPAADEAAAAITLGPGE